MNAVYVRSEMSLLLQITGGFAVVQVEEEAGQSVRMTDLGTVDGPKEPGFSCHELV